MRAAIQPATARSKSVPAVVTAANTGAAHVHQGTRAVEIEAIDRVLRSLGTGSTPAPTCSSRVRGVTALRTPELVVRADPVAMSERPLWPALRVDLSTCRTEHPLSCILPARQCLWKRAAERDVTASRTADARLGRPT